MDSETRARTLSISPVKKSCFLIAAKYSASFSHWLPQKSILLSPLSLLFHASEIENRSFSSFILLSLTLQMSSDSEDELVVKSADLHAFYDSHTRPMLEMERKR